MPAIEERYTIIDKIMITLIVLFSFYYLEPFFVWKTFAGGYFRNLFGVVPFRTLFGIAVVGLWICFYINKRTTKAEILLCGAVLINAFFTVVLAGGTENSEMLSLAWVPYFVVISYVLLPEKIQLKSYEVFVALFAVTLIMPIVYYALTHLGVNIPYIKLESAEEIKVIRGKYYKLYPFSTQLTSFLDPKWQELRMNGIYDESGRLGTVAGLILASEKYEIKGKWKNIVILIGGLCSFSLAFYAISIIYYVASCLGKKKYKNIVILFAAIIVYFLFMNISFSNPIIAQFQQRLVFTSDGLAGNNRTNAAFEGLMDEFYNSDTYSVLFGKGSGAISVIQNARNIDGSSYKSMIYDFGFVGFGLSIAWLFLYAYYYMRKKGADKAHVLVVLVVYLANMYQRPSVFYMGYLLIFFGGMIIAANAKPEK